MRNRLRQLLADNRRAFIPMQQRIVAAEDDGAETTIYLYDPIVRDRLEAEYWGGVCPQDFVPAVRAIKSAVLHLRINCPGGDVFGSEAMCQALRDHVKGGGRVVAHIEGLCASAATNLACAASEVLISSGSKYMIHKAWTLAVGNADDMRVMAGILDKCDETMIADYVRRSGNDTARITEWCVAETWFTAQEAIDAGFADRLADGSDQSPEARSKWNLSAYLHAPADVQTPAPGPADPEPDPYAEHRARQQQRLRLKQALPIA